MTRNGTPKFVFVSDAVADETFHVVRFQGAEALSSCYQFDILLISDKADLDLDAILDNPARLVIKREEGDLPFRGILSAFEQRHRSGGMVFCKARLVPRLWWTGQTHHNQIFLNKGPEAFLADVLEDDGLHQGLHFDFKLRGTYPDREYVCQYDESHFNFVSRWMERDGMYYFFEQTDQGEKMLITDSLSVHGPMAEGTALRFAPAADAASGEGREVIVDFMSRREPLPRKVVLKDYNYRRPDLEMRAEAEVASKGMGEVSLYGEHFQTPEEGERLARVRAEEYRCRGEVFHGRSRVPYLRAGYLFDLNDHPIDGLNQRYLTTEVTHEGSQEAYLVSGLGLRLNKHKDSLFYRNTFACIPAGTQFRAERTAVAPKFVGSMNARIDAAGSGQYAELDDQGRYKVVLPFDNSGRKDGRATTWLRMAQPYGGSDHGMHFPLHKGAEVLLTCIDGDPDRPIIQAAVPNPEAPSPVNDRSQTMNRLTTAGQNKLHIDDQEGQERMLLHTPGANTYLRMGVPGVDDPAMPPGAETLFAQQKETKNTLHGDGKLGWIIASDDLIQFTGGSANKIFLGHQFEAVGGAKESITVGGALGLTMGMATELTMARKLELFLAGKVDVSMARTLEVNAESGKSYKLGKVTTYTLDYTSCTLKRSTLGNEIAELDKERLQLENKATTLCESMDELVRRRDSILNAEERLKGEEEKICQEFAVMANNMTSFNNETKELVKTATKLTSQNNTLSESCQEIARKRDEIAQSSEKIASLVNNNSVKTDIM